MPATRHAVSTAPTCPGSGSPLVSRKRCAWGTKDSAGVFHHFAVEALDDREAEAVVFDDDIGEGTVHGAQDSQGFRGKAVEDLGRSVTGADIEGISQNFRPMRARTSRRTSAKAWMSLSVM